MIRAIYFNSDSKAQIISANDITPKSYEETYKGNLKCEYIGCNADIVFNERQKGKFIRYFSTKKGSNHRNGCPNEINHQGNLGPKIRVSGGKQSVSDDHIQDALKDAYRVFTNKSNPDKQIVIRRRPTPKNVPKTSDELQVSGVTVVSEAITTGNDNIIAKKKEPYIFKREVSDIASGDINTFKEVHSYVKDVRILSDCVYIDLVDNNNSNWSLLFDTPFKSLYEQEYQLLGKIRAYVYMKKQLNEKVICTSFGECKQIRNQYVVQIYSYKHFSLDNMWFYEIIRKMNKVG